MLGLLENPPSGQRADRAQVGVEALIVFVAMIIVAMLSVGVLLDTTGSLRNSATSTSEESTGQVVDRVSVFSVHDEDTRLVEQYVIRSRNVTLENRTVTLSNGGSSLSFDWDEPLTAAVDGAGNVTLEADGETMLVEDGHELRVTSHGGDRVSITNENTSEELPSGPATTDRISVQDDGDGSSETLTLSFEGTTLAAAETEDLTVRTTLSEIEFLNAEPVAASVSSGGTVTLAGEYGGTLDVGDGDVLRFYHANDTIRNLNTSTSTSMKEFAVVDDSDGTNGETLTLSYGGETVSLTESSPFRIEAFPTAEKIREDVGTARTVSVSSGGNVTLSDGGSTLELYDGNELRVTKPEPGAFELENVDSGATLRTDADALDVVDDGDGATSEILQIGPVVAKESAPSQLHLGIWTRTESADRNGIYTLTVGMNPGADSIDLADATVTLVGPANATTLTYVEVGAPMTRETFVVEPILDEGDTAPVLSDKADRFEIRFDAGPVPEGDDLIVRITTASGATREFIIEDDGEKQ